MTSSGQIRAAHEICGLNGAAMAALLSRAAIFGGTLYFMRMRLDMLTFNKPDR